jgi:hypothetical protein
MKKNGFTLMELLIGIFILFVVLSVLGAGCGGCGYNMVTRGKHTGEVTKIETLQNNYVVPSSRNNAPAAYSFAVELLVNDQYITFSSEDRQFATIAVGDKIEVMVLKYPPWNLEKSGTLYGGRLLKKFKQ